MFVAARVYGSLADSFVAGLSRWWEAELGHHSSCSLTLVLSYSPGAEGPLLAVLPSSLLYYMSFFYVV
jgi:hypothetical protein